MIDQKASEQSKKVFAFAVLYGFETKNFFNSELYEYLRESHKCVVLRRGFITRNFNEYIKRYSLDVTVLNIGIIKGRLKIENLFLASRRARQRIKKVGNFNYFKSDRKKRFSDYVVGNYFINGVLGKAAKSQITRHYSDSDVAKLYVQKGITDLVIAGYSSTEAMVLANTAVEGNRNVWLVINSWKDFYVNDFIPFTPTKTFVWSETMKKQLLAGNRHISARDVIVTGNPSFDRFYNYKPNHSIGYYGRKYNFITSRPLMLYSMISPVAYDKEKEVIELINLELIKAYPDESSRPVILLRRNPIDETPADESFYTGNNVRYADNYFEGSYENAIFIQLNEGEVEWLDLLYHAKININIASTVTLEALMMKTPVINIEFDSKGNQDKSLSRYAKAPFYLPLHNRGDVKIVSTLDRCVITIDIFLNKSVTFENTAPILDRFDGKATWQVIAKIKNMALQEN